MLLYPLANDIRESAKRAIRRNTYTKRGVLTGKIVKIIKDVRVKIVMKQSENNLKVMFLNPSNR